MNLNFEYILSVEFIKEKYPHIICKFCDRPLVNPIFCEICCDFICQTCPSTNISKQCCTNEKDKNLNDDMLFNGKGSIAKILEDLEISCTVNKVNGCKWIGKRFDYVQHYNNCNKNYQACIFGCGKIIHINDYDHYELCEKFIEWPNNDSVENDCEFRKKCLTQIKYNRYKNDRTTKILEILFEKNILRYDNKNINILPEPQLLTNYGREKITTIEELKKYPCESLVSYYHKDGTFRIGGYLWKINDDNFIYTNPDTKQKNRVRMENITEIWIENIWIGNINEIKKCVSDYLYNKLKVEIHNDSIVKQKNDTHENINKNRKNDDFNTKNTTKKIVSSDSSSDEDESSDEDDDSSDEDDLSPYFCFRANEIKKIKKTHPGHSASEYEKMADLEWKKYVIKNETLQIETREYLGEFTSIQLQSICKCLNIGYGGTKDKMRSRIVGYTGLSWDEINKKLGTKKYTFKCTRGHLYHSNKNMCNYFKKYKKSHNDSVNAYCEKCCNDRIFYQFDNPFYEDKD